MPAQKPLAAHVDPDAAALADLAAAARPATDIAAADADTHHGATEAERASLRAREQSERSRAGRASAAGKTRSYAFRRS
jgi:hypothetical protein